MPTALHRLILVFGALAACLSGASGLHAHGPLEFTTRATLHPDRLELVSALGADAARLVLRQAKCSPELIKASLLDLGPKHLVRQPDSVAATCFVLESAGASVPAQSITSHFDGMELLITFTFPRPSADLLSVRAVCLQYIPKLESGLFVLRDTAGRRLGGGLLSADNPTLRLSLPSPQAPGAVGSVSPLPPK
jgi:hypothetical protein